MKVWIYESTIDYEGIYQYFICETFDIAKSHAENSDIIPDVSIRIIAGDERIYETEIEST